MKTRRFLILLCSLLVSLGVGVYLRKPSVPQRCIRLPVRFFPFVDRPRIKVEIENKIYSLLVDLGSSHPIDLHAKAISAIRNKKTLGSSNYIGVRGKSYPTQAFQLPQIKLSSVAINGLVGFEENLDFLNDAKTWQSSSFWSRVKDQIERLVLDGRMGWTIFQKNVVLFDFPHSALIVAKDIGSLNEVLNYSLSSFTKSPFDLQACGIILQIETDLGIQKFLLDTGATCSVVKASLFTESTSSPYVTNRLKIGNIDFGPWKFHLLEYLDQNQYDGILGVDFFKSHEICLDFLNQIVSIH